MDGRIRCHPGGIVLGSDQKQPWRDAVHIIFGLESHPGGGLQHLTVEVADSAYHGPLLGCGMTEVVLWLKNEALPVDFMISLDERAILEEKDGSWINGFLVDFRVEKNLQ